MAPLVVVRLNYVILPVCTVDSIIISLTNCFCFSATCAGKTLLAKAVARLLGTAGSSDLQTGGAFIALNSSEVVQGEIGTSEKIIVAAFQSARENAPSV